MTTAPTTDTEATDADSTDQATAGPNVHDSVLGLLPSVDNPTPMVCVNRLSPRPETFTLLAKLEWHNPFGSVKDRAAASIIADLEERGELGPDRPGRGIVEPTSGNTGLSMAAIAAAKGYPMRAVMPNKVPLEKKLLLKIAGAEIDVVRDDLCPTPGAGDGSINLARTHARANRDGYTMPNQYENRANVEAHIRTTGPEIWKQTAGKVTHVFTSLGTCGTVSGCATFLKAQNPEIKIIAVQPSEGHDVPGLRNVGQLDVTTLYDPELIDEILEIEHEKSYPTALELARNEGLLAGPSSGLIFEGARRLIERDGAEGLGVMIFCDDAFKYTNNFAKHIPELLESTTPRG